MRELIEWTWSDSEDHASRFFVTHHSSLITLMSKEPLISPQLDAFYNQSSEEDRLLIGLGPLEFERNKELIQRFLPVSPGTIVDVGGGTGKYSEWLAEMGHDVRMIDPLQKHVSLAQKRSKKLSHPFQVLLGESRHLEIPDNTADLVILHGPLYHLQQRKERIRAILEAKRITKLTGVILGFAISYTASTLVALMQGLIHDQKILDMCLSELTSGKHEAPENMPGILAEAWYHRPEELRSEFEEANLINLEMMAVEGIIWLDKNWFTSRADQEKFKNLLNIAKLTEKDPNLISFSPHMMIAAKLR
ncbi:MAG: class I SAM-dependent methyltransferase [Bacteroidota bacterium]